MNGLTTDRLRFLKSCEQWGYVLSEAEEAQLAACRVSAPMAAQDKADADNKSGLGPFNCNHIIRAQGKAYPRACNRCKLGPCPFYQDDSAVPNGDAS